MPSYHVLVFNHIVLYFLDGYYVIYTYNLNEDNSKSNIQGYNI